MPLGPRRSLCMAAFGAAFLMLAASGSAGCGERRSVIDYLTIRYGERPAGLGIRPDGAVLELLQDRRDGSWTVLLSDREGRSCIVAAGRGLRLYRAKPKQTDEEAV